ncbi:MAG: hypothetical protein MUF86_15430, partial [Akkermansiaceae bacterium]|nr:hypothetical protein [Akkermansiaceae bacterium]
MSGIEDDGAEIARVADEVRAQHRINEFGEVHARDVGLVAIGGDLVGEDEFDAVHQALVTADLEVHLDLGVFEHDVVAVARQFGETVEALHAIHRDVIAAIDFRDFPTGGGRGEECCGNQRPQRQCQCHQAWRGGKRQLGFAGAALHGFPRVLTMQKPYDNRICGQFFPDGRESACRMSGGLGVAVCGQVRYKARIIAMKAH